MDREGGVHEKREQSSADFACFVSAFAGRTEDGSVDGAETNFVR